MVSVPINFILLVFTWLSFTSHNNNHKVLIHFFVETSSTRAKTLLARLQLVRHNQSDSVANPPLCLVSGPIAIATQRPYLLKLSKTRLVLQQTTTKQMIIPDYHRHRQVARVSILDRAKKVNCLLLEVTLPLSQLSIVHEKGS